MLLNSLNLDHLAMRQETSITALPDHVTSDESKLREVAKEFESVFLTEMLKHTGVGKARESFGGGVGEEGFASLLTQEYASMIADSGSFGLADQIYSALLKKSKK